jgi:hypothetical protein
MKIAVLSDIHDHIDKLKAALTSMNAKGAETIIFCGDMVSPFTTAQLAKANLPTYAVLGNNDEDQIGMMKKGANITWFHLSQEYGSIEIGGRKIAFCHYPRLAELLARSGEYNAVFYGHTHIAKNEMIGNTLLLNPGAVCGINFETEAYGTASIAIYDTTLNSAEVITI